MLAGKLAKGERPFQPFSALRGSDDTLRKDLAVLPDCPFKAAAGALTGRGLRRIDGMTGGATQRRRMKEGSRGAPGLPRARAIRPFPA